MSDGSLAKLAGVNGGDVNNTGDSGAFDSRMTNAKDPTARPQSGPATALGRGDSYVGQQSSKTSDTLAGPWELGEHGEEPDVAAQRFADGPQSQRPAKLLVANAKQLVQPGAQAESTQPNAKQLSQPAPQAGSVELKARQFAQPALLTRTVERRGKQPAQPAVQTEAVEQKAKQSTQPAMLTRVAERRSKQTAQSVLPVMAVESVAGRGPKSAHLENSAEPTVKQLKQFVLAAHAGKLSPEQIMQPALQAGITEQMAKQLAQLLQAAQSGKLSPEQVMQAGITEQMAKQLAQLLQAAQSGKLNPEQIMQPALQAAFSEQMTKQLVTKQLAQAGDREPAAEPKVLQNALDAFHGALQRSGTVHSSSMQIDPQRVGPVHADGSGSGLRANDESMKLPRALRMSFGELAQGDAQGQPRLSKREAIAPDVLNKAGSELAGTAPHAGGMAAAIRRRGGADIPRHRLQAGPVQQGGEAKDVNRTLPVEPSALGHHHASIRRQSQPDGRSLPVTPIMPVAFIAGEGTERRESVRNGVERFARILRLEAESGSHTGADAQDTILRMADRVGETRFDAELDGLLVQDARSVAEPVSPPITAGPQSPREGPPQVQSPLATLGLLGHEAQPTRIGFAQWGIGLWAAAQWGRGAGQWGQALGYWFGWRRWNWQWQGRREWAGIRFGERSADANRIRQSGKYRGRNRQRRKIANRFEERGRHTNRIRQRRRTTSRARLLAARFAGRRLQRRRKTGR